MYLIFEQLKFEQFVIYRGIHFTVWVLKYSLRKNVDCIVMLIYFNFDLKSWLIAV